MVSVQVGASIAKTVFPLVGPIGMVAVRIALGTAILVVSMRPWKARITRAAWPPLVIYGVSVGLMNLFYYLSLSRVPQGIAVAIEFIGPLAVAVLSSRHIVDLLWVIVAALALTLLLPVTHIGVETDLVGVLFALLAGGCWALYIVYGHKAGAHLGAHATAVGSVIAASVVVPIGFVSCGTALLSSSVLIPGLWVAVLATALPYTLEMFALTRLSPRTFGVLMSLEPACGALIGYVHLHEHLALVQWTAIVLLVAASIGVTASASQEQVKRAGECVV
jgi:inner membrane transporter RhtA